jgi:uncharacterized protein YqjF (DUF2071 family)
MSELLKVTAHRPFPPPERPYVGVMRWHDLLFAHWRADPEDVKNAMPPPLRPYLDVRDGAAWVGVVPFWMSNVRPRGVPLPPALSTMPEINVRTYVTIGGKPGVFFFSLDTTNMSAVLGARTMYSLPYFHARMAVWSDRHVGVHMPGPRRAASPNEVRYVAERTEPPLPAEFRATYRPTGEVFNGQPGSIDHFLTERYCLYTMRKDKILRVDIHHLPWPLQTANAEIELNTMAPSDGLVLPHVQPLLHFAKMLDVLVWWPEQVDQT